MAFHRLRRVGQGLGVGIRMLFVAANIWTKGVKKFCGARNHVNCMFQLRYGEWRLGFAVAEHRRSRSTSVLTTSRRMSRHSVRVRTRLRSSSRHTHPHLKLPFGAQWNEIAIRDPVFGPSTQVCRAATKATPKQLLCTALWVARTDTCLYEPLRSPVNLFSLGWTPTATQVFPAA